MYNIDEEIEQLKEIKDIQDELHILSVLLENQTSVLKQASEALNKNAEHQEVITPKSPISPSGNESKETARYSSSNDFHKLHLMLQEQEKRRKGLEVQAEQANKAVSPYASSLI